MNFLRRIRTALTVLKFIEQHGQALEWSVPSYDADGRRRGIHIYHAKASSPDGLVGDILGAASRHSPRPSVPSPSSLLP